MRKRWHTHRFIFQAYYENLKKCGIPVIWVEDEKENQKIIGNEHEMRYDNYGNLIEN